MKLKKTHRNSLAGLDTQALRKDSPGRVVEGRVVQSSHAQQHKVRA